MLGILASLALVRHRFRGSGPLSAFLLSPLVIPFVVFGISLLLLFHAVGLHLGIRTVVIGHIVITLPYTMLVLIPRLQQIDASLEEAAYDLGASRLRTFRSITLPADPARGRLRLPHRVHDVVRRVRVASFVKGETVTFPVYLYAALRFPSQLPQVIAVAVVVIAVSLVVVIARRGRTARRRAAPRSGGLGGTAPRRRAPTCAPAPTTA